MFRLAHISDVHLGPLPPVKFHQLASKRITGYLNWKLNRKGKMAGNYLGGLLDDIKSRQIDHIAVTGDLMNLSLPEEYKMAGNFLEQLGSPENVTANCGNHDAYIPSALQRSIDEWALYLSGDDKIISSPKDYPILRKRGDIAIIACNSAEATLPFFATGYFRKDQAKRLETVLEQTKDMYRIIMIHHPPFPNATSWAKRLIGQSRFREVILKQGAELILHGHTHLDTKTSIVGPAGDVPVVCVPAAGNAPGGHRPASRYNLFSIEKNKQNWSTTLEEYGFSDSQDGVGLVATHQL
jgi:3',5'-cyclic AMP phosphodiesterase CpdA